MEVLLTYPHDMDAKSMEQSARWMDRGDRFVQKSVHRAKRAQAVLDVHNKASLFCDVQVRGRKQELNEAEEKVATMQRQQIQQEETEEEDLRRREREHARALEKNRLEMQTLNTWANIGIMRMYSDQLANYSQWCKYQTMQLGARRLAKLNVARSEDEWNTWAHSAWEATTMAEHEVAEAARAEIRQSEIQLAEDADKSRAFEVEAAAMREVEQECSIQKQMRAANEYELCRARLSASYETLKEREKQQAADFEFLAKPLKMVNALMHTEVYPAQNSFENKLARQELADAAQLETRKPANASNETCESLDWKRPVFEMRTLSFMCERCHATCHTHERCHATC